MHHPGIGQPVGCLHQREFVNKTSICSIICVIRSKYNAVMSYYEVIKGYYGLIRVIMGYSGLLWGFVVPLPIRENVHCNNWLAFGFHYYSGPDITSYH